MADSAHNSADSPRDIEELDARVDALVQEVAAASDSAVATLAEPPEPNSSAPAHPASESDGPADGPEDPGEPAFDMADFQDASSVLSGAAAELTPPVAAEVPADPPHAAITPAPETEPQTDPESEGDAAPSAHRDAEMVAALESAANQAPVADIEQLDAALAAGAEKALHDAQQEIQDAAPPAPAQAPAASSEPEPPAPAAQTPQPEPLAPPEAAAQIAPVLPIPAPAADAAPRFSLGRFLAPTLAPLAAMHTRLGEPARQTVGYVAVMTFFFGAVVWGFVAFSEPHSAQPTSTPRYVQTSDSPEHSAADAHGGDEHAKPESSGGHGEHAPASGGHGEAKKEKAGPKKPAPKKPAEKASSTKKPAAKKDAPAAAHDGH